METKEWFNFLFFLCYIHLCFSSTVAVLCGELPFDDSNLVTLYRKIQVSSNSNESLDQLIDPLIINYPVLVLEHILHALFVQRGIYQVPAWVSASARDLLSQMLQVEPRRRITVPAIAAHAWTTSDAPHLAVDLRATSFQAPQLLSGFSALHTELLN